MCVDKNVISKSGATRLLIYPPPFLLWREKNAKLSLSLLVSYSTHYKSRICEFWTVFWFENEEKSRNQILFVFYFRLAHSLLLLNEQSDELHNIACFKFWLHHTIIKHKVCLVWCPLQFGGQSRYTCSVISIYKKHNTFNGVTYCVRNLHVLSGHIVQFSW